MQQWISTARPQQSTRLWPAVLVATLVLVGIATAAPTRTRPTFAAPVPGLPPRASSAKPRTVPAFIMELYKCWSKMGSGVACPSGVDVTQESVDLVRSFVGSVDVAPPKTLLSHNSEELSNCTTINFNLKCTQEEELFVDAEVRLFREPLGADRIEALESKCNLSDVRLELYSRTLLSNDGDSFVALESQIELSRDQLRSSQWIVFKNISQQYQRWMDNEQTSLSIAMGGSCRGVSPFEFGLSIGPNKEALVVGYYNMEGQITEMEKRFTRDLVGRMRREADVESDPTATTTTVPESRCQLYNHNISIAELGWEEYILAPKYYDANYCSGHCNVPLTEYHNTTKHSYIQAIAHYNDPTIIPSPCCVPIHLSHIPVIYVEQPINGSDPNVNLRDWKDVSADACGCR